MTFNDNKILAIAGVHKGATTSLYEYLMIHPEICAGKTKEIHYYTPLRFDNKLLPLDVYKKQFESCRGERYLLDASPSYLYGKSLIAGKIKEDFVDSKIIIILRDPADRFISFYKFLKAEFRLDESVSFASFLDESYSLRNEPDTSDLLRRAYREGVYADYIEDWLKVFGKDLKVIFFDDIKDDPQGVMRDICSWLGIGHGSYDDASIFAVRNKTRSSNSVLFYKMASFINNKFEMFFRKNPYFKDVLKRIYFAINGSKKNEHITQSAKNHLKGLYHEDNCRLSEILAKYGYTDLPAWLRSE